MKRVNLITEISDISSSENLVTSLQVRISRCLRTQLTFKTSKRIVAWIWQIFFHEILQLWRNFLSKYLSVIDVTDQYDRYLSDVQHLSAGLEIISCENVKLLKLVSVNWRRNFVDTQSGEYGVKQRTWLDRARTELQPKRTHHERKISWLSTNGRWRRNRRGVTVVRRCERERDTERILGTTKPARHQQSHLVPNKLTNMMRGRSYRSTPQVWVILDT